MLAPALGLAAADFAAFPLFSVVDGVPDAVARAALALLEQAPTLSAAELRDYLGITDCQARACLRVAGEGG